jgi:16S rRNA (guanine527-N7)-methyltransferase
MSDPGLVQALEEAQRLGMLGSRPIHEVITHSGVYLRGLRDLSGRVADLGSGGGVPGLLIAIERPDLEVWLIDRRGARADFLRRVVQRLNLSERVSVHETDAMRVAHSHPGSFDAVTARGFGPPEATLRIARKLIAPMGRILVSDPPDGNRWPMGVVAELGLVRDVYSEEFARVSVFHVKHLETEFLFPKPQPLPEDT